MILSENTDILEIYTLDSDGNRVNTGRLQKRTDPLQENEYFIGIQNWIVNHKGAFLM